MTLIYKEGHAFQRALRQILVRIGTERIGPDQPKSLDRTLGAALQDRAGVLPAATRNEPKLVSALVVPAGSVEIEVAQGGEGFNQPGGARHVVDRLGTDDGRSLRQARRLGGGIGAEPGSLGGSRVTGERLDRLGLLAGLKA